MNRSTFLGPRSDGTPRERLAQFRNRRPPSGRCDGARLNERRRGRGYHALLEKARESWDHFLTDELVYAVEPIKVDRDFKGGYVERYVRSHFQVELAFAYGIDGYLVAIIEAASSDDPRHVAELDHHLAKARDDFAVLVDSVDLVEPPEMLYERPIASVVRLKAFDHFMGLREHVQEFPVSTTASIFELAGVVEDGELCCTSRFSVPRVLERQLPSQVVKCRSEVVGDVPNSDAPLRRRLSVDFEVKNVLRAFTVVLGLDRVGLRVSSEELKDFRIQGVEMFLRPDDLEPNTIQRLGHGGRIPHSLAGRSGTGSSNLRAPAYHHAVLLLKADGSQ